MQVEEATNRLVRELRKAVPEWRKKTLSVHDSEILALNVILQYDEEVRCELKNLIEAIQEEQLTEMG